jgi:hypothetical protein
MANYVVLCSVTVANARDVLKMMWRETSVVRFKGNNISTTDRNYYIESKYYYLQESESNTVLSYFLLPVCQLTVSPISEKIFYLLCV